MKTVYKCEKCGMVLDDAEKMKIHEGVCTKDTIRRIFKGMNEMKAIVEKIYDGLPKNFHEQEECISTSFDAVFTALCDLEDELDYRLHHNE